MDMLTIICVVVLFVLLISQTVLSWLQIRRFNRAFLALKRGAYVAVGRNSRRHFRPRVLIALSFNEDKQVIDSILMQGNRFWALPKSVPQLQHKYIYEIDPVAIFPNQPACQSALKSALTTNNERR